MLKNFIIFTITSFCILLIQNVIIYVIDKLYKKNKETEIIFFDTFNFLIFPIFVGFLYTIAEILNNSMNYKFLVAILFSSLFVSYWFFVAPIFHVFKKKIFERDINLENVIFNKGFKYKIYYTSCLKTNAYATGSIPFFKFIVLSDDLKHLLEPEELNAIVFHEIGHHEEKHIIKLYYVNVLCFTLYYLTIDFIINIGFEKIYEFISILVVAGFGGLMFYYLPNKIIYYYEFKADMFAAKIVGAETFKKTLIKVDNLTHGKLNKGNINHPTLEKRLLNIK